MRVGWLVAAALAAASIGAGCAPAKLRPPAPPNGTRFEMAVAGAVNKLRAREGRPALGWSNNDGNRAQAAVDKCAARNGGETDDPNTPESNDGLRLCHTSEGEDLIMWSGCDETAERAAGIVDRFAASPAHLNYLIDTGGWPPGQSQGVGVTCDTTTNAGVPMQYTAIAISH
jgi:hypothetical protein